ncbi:MAG: ASKHA domain-containing protein, partial [Synergistaceae bacterium]|nr:ASKHA domain-containing protein [Synergistaceae bacterium]
MPNVTFIGKSTIDVSRGITVLQAARAAGLAVESPCNGVGQCGKCRGRVSGNSLENVKSPPNAALSDEQRADGWVLTCEASIIGDIEVFLPDGEREGTLKILEKGLGFEAKLNPGVRKEYDASRDVTLVFGHRSPDSRASAPSAVGPEALLCEEAGDTSRLAYGLSLDIGTTTLALSLVDLNTGSELDSVSAMNPQAVYAQDVLSRIKFASEPEGLETLRGALMEGLGGMISQITDRCEVPKEHIYEIVCSGNTCMLHLAVGVNPESLGRYPYTPLIEGAKLLRAPELGIAGVAECALAYLPPGISAYVGADITSGILAALLFERKGVTLFMDIGTNGEMVVASDGRLRAVSTAAGPAFEGMNITMGMRAEKGAVERFEIADGRISLDTIGGAAPVGVCGSGLIDIVGELASNGVLGSNGRFVNSDSGKPPRFLTDRITEYNGKPAFRVSGDVILAQKDVRQVQLAKGALRAGLEYLLRAIDMTPSDVDEVLIAGSFGYHLRA